jgi:hypothetical protein
MLCPSKAVFEEKFREERVREGDVDVTSRYIPPPLPPSVVFVEQEEKLEEVMEREEEERMCLIPPPPVDVVDLHEILQLVMVVVGWVEEKE